MGRYGDGSQLDAVTLAIGQAVAWAPSPTGFAQVEDLHRSRVTIGYRRKGRWYRRTIAVSELLDEPLLIQMENPFGRGVWPRQKTFEVKP